MSSRHVRRMPEVLKNRSFPSWTAPIVGALVTIYLLYRFDFLGKGPSLLRIAFAGAIGFLGGGVLWFMDFIENRAKKSDAPNATVSIIVLALVPFTFWIPLLGLIITSFAIHRAHWLALPDWISFIVACLWFLALGITLVLGVFFGVDFFTGR